MNNQEPITVDWNPDAAPIEHSMIAELDGIFQCFDCGRWTKHGIEALKAVACTETSEDVKIEDLEV